MTDITPTTTYPVKCRYCGETYQCDEPNPGFMYCLCKTCEDRIESEEQERERRALEKEISKTIARLTPPRFRQTDIHHPAFNLRLWEQVKEWNPSDKIPWLGLIGETGLCKTRNAYLRLEEVVRTPKRLQYPDRKTESLVYETSIEVITASEFAHAVRNQYSQNAEEARDCRNLLDSAHSVKWLLFDDLGKFTNTPAIIAALFGLIDHRHSYNKPTIWTSNLPPEEFLASAPADIGAPLAGRLIECSTIFTV
jgi:hypothetical protein